MAHLSTPADMYLVVFVAGAYQVNTIESNDMRWDSQELAQNSLDLA